MSFVYKFSLLLECTPLLCTRSFDSVVTLTQLCFYFFLLRSEQNDHILPNRPMWPAAVNVYQWNLPTYSGEIYIKNSTVCMLQLLQSRRQSRLRWTGWVGMIKARYLEDGNVEGRLITKFILEIYSVKLWDGFSWLRRSSQWQHCENTVTNRKVLISAEKLTAFEIKSYSKGLVSLHHIHH